MARFALVRVLGNDLVPLHDAGQTERNLEFLLAHEPDLPGCERLFILNRIADPAREAALAARLEAAGHAPHRIPFEPDAWRALQHPMEKLHYVTNNNPARNTALALGAERAPYTLPFDGQVTFTAAGWKAFAADVDAAPEAQVFVVPMYRVQDNAEVLDPARAADLDALEAAEPQLAFARAAPERFDERIPYGLGPKVDLLLRLGVPGPWDRWPGSYFVRMREAARTRHAANHGRTVRAGHVLRLAPGTDVGAGNIGARNAARQRGMMLLVANIDARLAP